MKRRGPIPAKEIGLSITQQKGESNKKRKDFKGQIQVDLALWICILIKPLI